MSKKFIKVLGISLLIILLPVLIVTSAIALDRVILESSVISKYGTESKITYDEGKKTWTFSSLPTRDFYILKGITVDGIDGVFEINASKEVVVDEDKQVAFKQAIEAKKQVETVWTCVYSDIIIETGSNWENRAWEFYDSVTTYGGSINAIEEIQLFDLLEYDFTEYPLTQMRIKTLTAEGVYITSPIAISYDSAVKGDMSVAEFLSLILEKNIVLNTLEGNVLKVMIYG